MTKIKLLKNIEVVRIEDEIYQELYENQKYGPTLIVSQNCEVFRAGDELFFVPYMNDAVLFFKDGFYYTLKNDVVLIKNEHFEVLDV